MPENSPKTVIVLGAGASCDCGFPTGIELINEIVRLNLGGYDREVMRIIWNSKDLITRDNRLDQLPEPLSKFLNEWTEHGFFKLSSDIFTDWVQLLPAFKSIDDFIYYRQEYSVLAKLSVAKVLSDKERPGFFGITRDGVNRKWYHLFFGEIVKNARTLEHVYSVLDSLCIISFNYDRSLEYFLRTSISSVFRIPQNEVKPLPIVHVYGSIGGLVDSDKNVYHPYSPIDAINHQLESLPWGTLPVELFPPIPDDLYKQRSRDRYLYRLSSRIETYGKDYPKGKQRELQKIIQDAKNVYFFGLAFHKQNLSLLLDQSLGLTIARANKVDGTFYGLPEELRNELVNRFTYYFKDASSVKEPKDMKVEDYFKNYSLSL